MNSDQEITISEYPSGLRDGLVRILEDSFAGWYLRHAVRTLRECDTVLVAHEGKTPVALSMLQRLDRDTGYVFYIAVLPQSRRKGVGSSLLESCLHYFADAGCRRVYAAVEKDNEPSKHLFESKGFVMTGYGEVSKLYGRVKAVLMYRRMVVVPGEVLLVRELEAPRPQSP